MSAQSPAPRLRPLGIGEILDVGIKIYTRNWLTLWKIVVFVVLPAQVLVNAIQVSALPNGVNLSGGGPGFSSGQPVFISHHDAVVLAVGVGASVLISFIATQLAQAGCFRAVADAYLGEEAHWSSSLRYALRRLPAVVVLTIVAGILEALGLIFCVIPGIYLWGAFSVAIPALLVEGAGPFRALGRSRRLVKGRWWTTFGVAIVGYLLVAIISTALTALVVGVAFANPARNTATGFVLNTLASTVGSMLTTPAAAAFATVLYIDLRVRKEGFDLFLLAQRLGVEREPGTEVAAPDFFPEAPAWTADKPPYWPPPPGWTPGPPAPPDPETAFPPVEPDQPPFWPPPPGWKPRQ
ncbi:MAG TPA: hypothetical protein VMU72_04015 [Gaiellaceae bacterium]|nr:hypothetical protein [Gaiellaceae bacterium]